MPRPKDVYNKIHEITAHLIGLGLSDGQQYPSIREVGGGVTMIDVSGGALAGSGFGGRPYREVYAEIEAAKAYNIRLLDGGLLLLQYMFRNGTVTKHRLAFWASPTLESFQNEPELYESDELYLDFLDRSIVPFPIRFDFGLEETANAPIMHPRSHLTLGQYQNCRIPVSSPLAPSVFVDFVLRNFYSSAHKRFSSVAARSVDDFDNSLYDEEQSIPHLVLTKGRASSVARTVRSLLGRRPR